MSQLFSPGLGARIAHYRHLNGWSAHQLAAYTGLGVSRDTLANIESARRDNLSLRQFLAISYTLRIPPTALLLDLENPFAPAGLKFHGPAPVPLTEDAPIAAAARWMNGTTVPDEPPAAGQVRALQDHIDARLTTLDSRARARTLRTPAAR